jgi:homoserine kinase type II
MAVYTQVPAEALDRFLERYDVGSLVSAKGIAEGVENSNYLVETSRGRFILTLYEKRVAEADLPYFLALKTHLADKRLPVPRPITDRGGRALQSLQGRPACLIEFLPGVSLSEPTPDHCRAAAEALGRMHEAARDFTLVRENSLSLPGWRRLATACADRADEITPGLSAAIRDELSFLEAAWPHRLERSTIHADLFPDNVLVRGREIAGLIDFYFACTDIRAYDLAVMHTSWAFSGDGGVHHSERAAALDEGYARGHGLTDDERAALPVLCRGACLRFLLTRTYDWLNTPAGALVTRKDPLAYLRRLRHYQAA